MIGEDRVGRAFGHPGAVEHGDVQHAVRDVIVDEPERVLSIRRIADLTSDRPTIDDAVHHLIQVVDVSAPSLPERTDIDIGSVKIAFQVRAEIARIVGYVAGIKLNCLGCPPIRLTLRSWGATVYRNQAPSKR